MYKKQFGEEAKGNIATIIRLRPGREVMQFCKEKYGTPFPQKTEFGYLKWLHVPWFSMPYSPMGLRENPYLIINEEYIDKKNVIDQLIQEHFVKRPRINGKLVRILYSKIQKREYYKSHPEIQEHRDEIEEWQKKLDELQNQRMFLKVETKPLSTEQLELLGINYDAYDHGRYWGGKAVLKIKGKSMEVAPEFGKVL